MVLTRYRQTLGLGVQGEMEDELVRRDDCGRSSCTHQEVFSINDVSLGVKKMLLQRRVDGHNHQKPHAFNNVSEEKGTGFL